MRSSLLPCISKSSFRLLQLAFLIIACGGPTVIRAATNKSPVLLSDANSTRAIAVESVTMKPEPFPLTASVKFGADNRTRIAVFARNLELLAGEGVNAFTSDVQDATGKRYPLSVEYQGPVPNFPGITMLIVRLADDLGDVGDVLLRINLHGMSSNRVRIAIGHVGGGPADDPGAAPTPVTGDPLVAEPPLTPDSYTGPASDADTVRFLEQASWGPTSAEITREKAMSFQAYLNEQFAAPVFNPAKGSNYPDLTFPPDDTAIGCPTGSPPECARDNYTLYPIQRTFYSNSLYGQDQLRQRVAWALHQIFVVSG
ncbi:MAG TPA: DUF1800 family protein, partial [Pyrinomonadaceae bacterium]|nr:DUF1800 family protein [Pyrinomonadaceae bacterium]